MNEDDATQAAPQSADSAPKATGHIFHVRFHNGEMKNVKADQYVRDEHDYTFYFVEATDAPVLCTPIQNVLWIELVADVTESAS